MFYSKDILDFIIIPAATGGRAWAQSGPLVKHWAPLFVGSIALSMLGLLSLSGRLRGPLVRGIGQVAARSRRTPLWRLLRPRIGQVALEMLFVSGLLIISELLLAFTLRLEVMHRFGPSTVAYGFWSIVALLLLAPLVAIWRNCSALSLLLSEVWETHRLPRGVLENMIKSMVFLLMFTWIYLLLPDAPFARWGWLLIVAGAAVIAARFSRQLVFWHSHVHLSIREAWVERFHPWMKVPVLLGEAPGRANGVKAEVTLPANVSARDCSEMVDDSRAGNRSATTAMVLDVWVVTDEQAGKTLDDLVLGVRSGLWVVGLQRNGRRIINPKSDESLIAGDEILIAGPTQNLRESHRERDARTGTTAFRVPAVTTRYAG